MPCETQEVQERYWTWCRWWYVWYPCRKTRTVTKWCCQFVWVKETRKGLWCSLEGCSDDGLLYKWNAFCFGFGSAVYNDVFKCFGSVREPEGECTPFGTTPSHVERVEVKAP
jgi:hypothetical protein